MRISNFEYTYTQDIGILHIWLNGRTCDRVHLFHQILLQHLPCQRAYDLQTNRVLNFTYIDTHRTVRGWAYVSCPNTGTFRFSILMWMFIRHKALTSPYDNIITYWTNADIYAHIFLYV